jgi:spore coat protein CotH
VNSPNSFRRSKALNPVKIFTRSRARKKSRSASGSLSYEKLEPKNLLAGVVISEIVASNIASFEDGFGSSPDWIELHNQGTTAVDLQGYHLTDNANDPIGWTFETSEIIGAGEYLIVFASAENTVDPLGFHHTDFKLSASGEYIGLYDASGVLLSEFGAGGVDYPQQIPDVSYGSSAGGLVSAQTVGEYLIPQNGSLGTSWTANGFNGAANGFTASRASLGYENSPGSNTSYADEYATAVPSGTTSLYLRTEFVVTDASAITDLTLGMRFDDGFGVYLNGTHLFGVNDGNGYAWNTSASANHDDNAALNYIDYALDGSAGSVGNFLNLLVDGTNTLAIHALNMPSSSDFLIEPRLVTSSVTGVPGYLETPTPGSANLGSITIGPAITDVTPNGTIINQGQSLVITANVSQFNLPVDDSSVRLLYQVMYGNQFNVQMNDSGIGADVIAGDGIFSATLNSSNANPGDLVRWYVTAADVDGNTSRAPLFFDPLNSAEYFGTVVTDPSIDTDLPVFHWFLQNTSAAQTDAGTRGSLFFNGEFYDNIQTDIHGQSTRGNEFPKKSFDFDANSGDKFWVSDEIGRASDFNLLTNYADQTKLRHPLGYQIYEETGHPGLKGLPVTVYRNGSYYGLFDIIEEGQTEFLDRVGLDTNGALYKVNNNLTHAYNEVQKKTRLYENNSDFQAVVNANALSGASARIWDFDNMDTATLINYLAVNAIIANNDFGNKNMYWYRDTEGTGQWLTLPWDQDLSFGHNWNALVSPPYFDNTLYTNGTITAGWTNLFQRTMSNSRTAEMYFRRLKTLSDQFYGETGTAISDSWMYQRMEEIRNLISDESVDDMAFWGLQANYTASYPFNPSQAIDQLQDVFLNARRNTINNDGRTPSAQVGNPGIVFDQVDFDSNPASGLQAEEYVRLNNPTSSAVDISGWTLTGGIQHTFKPGTVIPAGDTLYVLKDVVAFKARATGPTGGQQLFIQGNYDGQLANLGDTVNLVAADGAVMDVLVTPDTGASTNQEFLRVSEFNYNPAVSVDNAEYIEFLNTSSTDTLNLAGVTISEGPSDPFVFAAGTTLAPGDRLLVVGDLGAFTAAYPSVSSSLIAGTYSGKLSNGGENLRVDDVGGEKILEVSYGDTDPWYFGTDGDGQTLQLVDEFNTSLLLMDKFYSWRPSLAFNGTPGAAPIVAPSVVINEVLAHTDTPQLDSVELFNPTGSDIIIGGMYLSDSANNFLKYQIPAGTLLPAGGYVVFDESHFNPTPGSPGPDDFSFSSSNGDQVWLTTAVGGVPSVMVAQVDFGATFNGEALARVPNGTGRLLPALTTTLGAENGVEKVGPLVISEVNYHPADPSAAALAIYPALTDGDLEFIEVHNPTLQTVGLTDWRLRGESDFDFPAGTNLGPGGTIVVVNFDPALAANSALLNAFRAEYGIGNSVNVFGPLNFNLSNSYGRVSLQQPDTPPLDDPTLIPYVLVDEVVYDDLAPWNVSADGTGPSLTRDQIGVRGTLASNRNAATPTPGSADMGSTVFGRQLVYNGSSFNAGEDIAIDKSPLFDGQTATFENYTSYVHGINGIVLDVVGLSATPTVNDFEFRIGNNNSISTWSTAPAPSSLTVLPGQGVGGSDRITLNWANGAITNTWLQVELLANANTGLDQSDIFYFGNAIAETGDNPLTTRVNLIDVGLTRANQTGFVLATIDNVYDFNRDRRVNLIDVGLARVNQTGFTSLSLIVPNSSARGSDSSDDGKGKDGSVVYEKPFVGPVVPTSLSAAVFSAELAPGVETTSRSATESKSSGALACSRFDAHFAELAGLSGAVEHDALPIAAFDQHDEDEDQRDSFSNDFLPVIDETFETLA